MLTDYIVYSERQLVRGGLTDKKAYQELLRRTEALSCEILPEYITLYGLSTKNLEHILRHVLNAFDHVLRRYVQRGEHLSLEENHFFEFYKTTIRYRTEDMYLRSTSKSWSIKVLDWFVNKK